MPFNSRNVYGRARSSEWGRTFRLLVLVPVLLLVIGCLGELDPYPSFRALPESVARADLCELLSPTEVERYWGYPNPTPELSRTELPPGVTCGYDDDDYGTIIRLNLSLASALPCDEWRDSPNSEGIGGIGDWAYYSHDHQKLYAQKGDLCLEVVPGLTPGDPSLDAMTSLKELARIAVGRL